VAYFFGHPASSDLAVTSMFLLFIALTNHFSSGREVTQKFVRDFYGIFDAKPCGHCWSLPFRITVIHFDVAITCEPLIFRTVSSPATGLWSVVNVTCPAGQRLISAATAIVTTCDGRGEWRPPVPDCTRNSVFCTLFLTVYLFIIALNYRKYKLLCVLRYFCTFFSSVSLLYF